MVPYPARVAVGVAATLVEETRRLPATAITLPMTAVSQTLQTLMRVQQQVAEFAIKGDEVLDALFHTDEEQPSWATFDEDETEVDFSVLSGSGASDEDDDAPTEVSKGRFALYSEVPDQVDELQPVPSSAAVPEIASYLEYDNLTLAQLRAKLRGVGVDELQELVDYEQSARSRAPFITLLENRITAATR